MPCCITQSFQLSSLVHYGSHGTTAVPHQALLFMMATDRASASCACVCQSPCIPRKSKRALSGSLDKRCNCGAGRYLTTLPRNFKATRSHGIHYSYSDRSSTAVVQQQWYNITRAARCGLCDSHGIHYSYSDSSSPAVVQQQWYNITRAARCGLCDSLGAFVFVCAAYTRRYTLVTTASSSTFARPSCSLSHTSSNLS